jgi:O-antigen ligase
MLLAVICITSNLIYSHFSLFKEKTAGTLKSFMDNTPKLNNPDSYTQNIPDRHARNSYAILSHYRTVPWRGACRIIRQYPFRGYGLNFIILPGYGTHSTYLMAFLASGAIGFTFFMLGLVFLFKIIKKRFASSQDWVKSSFFLAVFFSLASWLVVGLLQSIINHYAIWTIASLGMLRGEDLLA